MYNKAFRLVHSWKDASCTFLKYIKGRPPGAYRETKNNASIKRIF